MPGTIPELGTIAGSPDGDDLIEFVDVSDNTMAEAGTNKQTTITDLLAFHLKNTGSGTNSTAAGFANSAIADSDATTSFGNMASATSAYATAVGASSLADGIGSTAFGAQSVADHADGQVTAIGAYAQATGVSSTSLGYSAQALGGSSTAIGTNAVATEADSVAIGKDSLTEVGGNNAVAIGVSSSAGKQSVAVGHTSDCSGSYSVAVGANTACNSAYGTAVGHTASAGAYAATALGKSASAAFASSVAVGYNSVASAADRFAVGSAGAKRIVEHVAPGVSAFHSINVEQDSVNLHSFLGRQFSFFAQPDFSALTSLGISTGGVTVSGTENNPGSTSASFYTRMQRKHFISSASAGNLCGARHGYKGISLGVPGTPNIGGFHYVARFASDDAATVADARQFVGVTNTTAAPAGSFTPSGFTNVIGMGHGSGDANMQIYYGGSAAQTPIDLGSSFPANTNGVDVYQFELYADPGIDNEVNYKVTRLNTGDVASGTLTGTAGTALPANTSMLTTLYAYRSNGATALEVRLAVNMISARAWGY